MRKAISNLASVALVAALVTPAHAQGIQFGDDSSQWANNGMCDDPRFEGEGVAVVVFDQDIARDATDCKALYDAGSIRLRGTSGSNSGSGFPDFGDDSSQWANDGECDDPRFEGSGMAGILLDEDILRDASDCKALYDAGSISVRGTANATSFGDDSSEWANDGECDDPRFEGQGMATSLVRADAYKDATDCRTLYAAGMIQERSDGGEFGDNSSRWANDGECDDPRFNGPGMAETLLDEDLGRDANDCRTLYNEGRIGFAG